MLCKICGKKPANVHFTEIIDTQKKEIHLCIECAKKKGFNLAIKHTESSLAEFISGLAELDIEEAFFVQEAKKQCSNCGLTYNQFMKIGKLGCSNCYFVFEQNLSSLLRRIHGSTQHIGKIPQPFKEKTLEKMEIEQLKRKLQLAIKKEEFEKAAQLRDKIRFLEKKSK